MDIWAIIPVKSLGLTKSRLTAVLTPSERADLTRQLLSRLLNVLVDSNVIAHMVVVSRDEGVHQLARPLGAITAAEPPNAGLNEAIDAGVQLALLGLADRVLVLPSDLPYLTPEDVAMVGESAADITGNCIICPDRHELGTNALLFPPDRNFQFQFGFNSFLKHQQEAKRSRLKVKIIRTLGWQFDLDTVEDWQIYSSTKVKEL